MNRSSIPFAPFKLVIFFLLLTVNIGFNRVLAQLPAIVNYKLDIRLDYNNERLNGRCTLTLQNRSDRALDTIPLLLYRLLAVKNITDEKGNPLPFSQEIINIKGWEKIQVNFTQIFLDRTISPEDSLTIIVDYDGYLLGYEKEGWRYVKDHISKEFTIIRTDGFDYPVVGHPSEEEMMAIIKERYNYQVSVTAPDYVMAVSGAELVSQTRKGNEITWVFKSRRPSWRLDVALSDYGVFEKNGDTIYYFRADSLSAQSMLNTLESTFHIYTTWFGPVEGYTGYTIIEVPEGYSSQQDVTSCNITSDNFRSPEGKQSIYHELSHLWNVKELETQPCRFESEGLARFLEYLLIEKYDSSKNSMQKKAQLYIDEIRETFRKNPDYINIPVKDYGIKDMTYYSYNLGMVIFALFYDLAGQDAFNRIIRSYYSLFHERGATLDDFISCCGKEVQFDSHSFFVDWVYSDYGIKQIVAGKNFTDLLSFYKKKTGKV